MDLIQSSKDIMYIVMAFGIFLLSAFFAWLLYYMIMIIRQVYVMTKEMRARINKVDETFRAFKEKFDHGASYLLLISEGIKKLVEVAGEYNGKKKTGKKK